MKHLISAFTIASFGVLSALPLQSEPNNLPLCYMITSSGRLINLDSLCIKGAIDNYYRQLADDAGFTFENGQFAYLKIGMRYSEVVAILGKEGKELSVVESGDNIRATYSWKHRSGSEIRAIFEGGSKPENRQLVAKKLL